MFEVKVPDSTDFEWVREEAKMRARLTPNIQRQNPALTPAEVKAMVDSELKINKPLGREQRMKLEKKNIAQANLSVEDKIKELGQEISQGQALNNTAKADVLAQLALSFQNLKAEQGVNFSVLGSTIAQILNGTGAKTLSYKQLFGANQPRIVDYTFVSANTGQLMIYLYSWVSSQDNPAGIRYITYNKPVYDIKNPIDRKDLSKGFEIDKVSFASMKTDTNRVGDKRRYLDLANRALITPYQANYIANNMVANSEIKTAEEAFDPAVDQAIKDYILQDPRNIKFAGYITGLPDTSLFKLSDTVPPVGFINSTP
jgi:hypothetical protein